jgi:multiple sugar transport system substrate-binding protein
MKLKHLAAAALFGGALVAASPAFAQEKITVWWEKGFYKAEDDALFAVVKKFEDKYKIKVELSLYANPEVIPKTVAALDAGNPPDVGFGNLYDFNITSTWAYAGKLEDITSVIEPMRAKFEPRALSTTFLYNDVAKTRAYYAFPIRQQTMHIQYWKDMVADAGFKESDIPTTWKEYWNFWCDKVQPAYRQKTGNRGFGIGQPMGVDSSDSFFSFLTFMDGYNVQLVSDSGKVLVDDPAVREGLIKAMTDYTAVYSKGCTPPSSTNWRDPDNNVAFTNKTTVLTHNATISIVAAQLDASTNATLTEAQRAQAKMTYRAAVKTGVIFKDAKNKPGAKKFVAFLLEDANLTPYIEGSLGRWFPVTKAPQQSAFWKSDPHRLVVYNQFMAGTTAFEFTKNHKFAQLNNENVWAKTMNRILNDKLPVDKAVDEMIARIKTVAGN